MLIIYQLHLLKQMLANWRWYVEAMVQFIGVLKQEEKKEKDNQYKLKKAMATPLA